MKRLLMRLLLVLTLGVVLWQGALATRSLFRRPARHEAVIVNTGRRAIATLELRVGAQRFALGALAPRDTARANFRVARDAPVGLRWSWEDAPADDQLWRGEWIAGGPVSYRLSIRIRDDGGVLSRVAPAP